MAPNAESTTLSGFSEAVKKEPKKFKPQLVFFNASVYALLHLAGLYGTYLVFTSAQWKTILFAFTYSNMGMIGITAGAHRLWSHRTYKAKLPLRILLSVFCSIAAQNSIFVWCRDHRGHHKYSETDADPHNIKRGFFFAHVGWLMSKKHPDVIEKGKSISMDDLLADPVIRFQTKYYFSMVLLFNLLIPATIPQYFWGESLRNSLFVAAFGRYCYSLHVTWFVNSAAHMFGNRPYDKLIEAKENPIVSFLALGEGWHNYHHAFPYDYSTSELGYTLNVTKVFIDFMALIGQAYDLKRAHPRSIASKMVKSGDGSRIHDEDGSTMHHRDLTQ